MVSTRDARKRLLEGEGGEDDACAVEEREIAVFERALAESKEVRARRSKQRRVENWRRKHPPFEILPVDILPRIFLYLDSARNVMSLAMCSKYLYKTLTPEIVVRAAVFNGDKEQRAVTEIVDAVKNNRIHVPSTNRLLRLVTGTSCERTDQCFELNTENGKSGEVRGGTRFGMLICSTCSRSLSIANRNMWYTDKDEIFPELTCYPQAESVTGDPIGPTVLAKDICQIEATFPDRGTRMERLTALLDDKRGGQSDKDKAQANMLIKVFDQAASEYPNFVLAKRNALIDRNRRKQEARAAKRRSSILPVYEAMETLLEDYEHKSKVLDCVWGEYTGNCTLTYGLSHEILGPLLSAPSGASKRKIRIATESIKECFETLLRATKFSSELLGVNSSSPRHKKALFAHLKTISPEDLLKRRSRNRLAVSIHEGRLWNAFCGILHQNDFKDGFTRAALSRTREFMREACKRLATTVWSIHPSTNSAHQPLNIKSYGDWLRRFNVSYHCYMTLIVRLSDYLGLPETVAFMNEMNEEEEGIFAGLGGREVIQRTIYREAYIHDLWHGRFETLRMRQEEVFLNPQAHRRDLSLG